MSKVVKVVGNVVKSVGRAVGNVVQGAANLVKKVVTSKVGKMVVAAAAIYFTAGAALGAIGGASAGATAGPGFWGTIGGAITGAGSGAAAGLSQAWTGLTGAASALTGGGGSVFGSLSDGLLNAGFKGAKTAGGGGIMGYGGLFGPPASLTSTGVNLAGGAAGAGSVSVPTRTALAAQDVAINTPSSRLVATPTGGVIGNLMSGPYAVPALVKAGGQLISSVGQGYMAQQQQQRQDRLDDEARRRLSANVGTPLFRPV